MEFILGHHDVGCCCPKKICTAQQHQNLIPTVKYCGGPSWFGGALLSQGLGRLLTGKMISQVYQDILQENWRPSARQLNIGRGDNRSMTQIDPNRSESTTEGKKKYWSQPHWDAATPREQLRPDNLRILLTWISFIKRNHPRWFSWLLCRFSLQLQKTFGWGYCCQKSVK